MKSQGTPLRSKWPSDKFESVRKYQHVLLALVSAFGMLSCASSSQKNIPRTLTEDVIIERLQPSINRLYKESDDSWDLYAGPTPAQIDWKNKLAVWKGRDSLLDVPFQPRTFWGLISSTQDTLIATEREIPFAKAKNFRDLGGIPTADGRRVKWGLIYRSGKLDKLSKLDQLQLQNLGLKTVVDFRSDQEVEEEPDNLPAGIQYERVIIGIDQAIDRDKLLDSLKSMTPAQSGNLLVEANKLFAGSSAKDYSPFIEMISDTEQVPLVYHCTAGKDRTGFATALVLSALDVDRETIMQDFLMSNYYRRGYKNFRMNFVWLVGLDREVLSPLMEVRQSYLEAAFHTIDSLYGDTDTFLESVYGLNDSIRQEWKERYTY